MGNGEKESDGEGEKKKKKERKKGKKQEKRVKIDGDGVAGRLGRKNKRGRRRKILYILKPNATKHCS